MKDIYDHGYSVSTENFSEGPTVTDSNLTMSCDSSLVYICEAYIQPILLAIGILTNAASLVILPRTRIVPTFKICLIALAISDLCATTTGFTQMLVEVIAYDGDVPFGYWEGPAVASYSLYFLFILFMCASAGLVILIVAIRSAMVSRPLSARRFLTNGRTGKLCLCVLIVTTLLFAPTTLNILWQSCYHDTETQFCIDLLDVFPYLENVSNSYLYVITVIYGPLLVLIYIGCFIGIKISLNKTQKMIRELSQRKSTLEPGGKVKNKMSKTAKVTRTLLVILVLDTCCTLPQVIQGVGLIFSPTTTIFDNDTCWYDTFDVFVEICLCLRPTYNFWLYCFSHKDFRDRCRYQLMKLQYYCCRGPCKLEQKPQDINSSSDGTGSSPLHWRTRHRGSPSHSSLTVTDLRNSTDQLDSAGKPRGLVHKSSSVKFQRQSSLNRIKLLKATFRNYRDSRSQCESSAKVADKRQKQEIKGLISQGKMSCGVDAVLSDNDTNQITSV